MKLNFIFQVCENFDDMGLREDLLRGIFAYGFEKPSAIQQRGTLPLIKGRDTIAQVSRLTSLAIEAIFSIKRSPQHVLTFARVLLIRLNLGLARLLPSRLGNFQSFRMCSWPFVN